jgi:hypothetical protein
VSNLKVFGDLMMVIKWMRGEFMAGILFPNPIFEEFKRCNMFLTKSLLFMSINSSTLKHILFPKKVSSWM